MSMGVLCDSYSYSFKLSKTGLYHESMRKIHIYFYYKETTLHERRSGINLSENEVMVIESSIYRLVDGRSCLPSTSYELNLCSLIFATPPSPTYSILPSITGGLEFIQPLLPSRHPNLETCATAVYHIPTVITNLTHPFIIIFPLFHRHIP